MAVECTPNSLAASAACFMCLEPQQMAAIQTLLLCIIANNGGGGGGGLGQIKYYLADPNGEVVVPDDQTQPAIAITKTGGTLYSWSTDDLQWH